MGKNHEGDRDSKEDGGGVEDAQEGPGYEGSGEKFGISGTDIELGEMVRRKDK